MDSQLPGGCVGCQPGCAKCPAPKHSKVCLTLSQLYGWSNKRDCPQKSLLLAVPMPSLLQGALLSSTLILLGAGNSTCSESMGVIALSTSSPIHLQDRPWRGSLARAGPPLWSPPNSASGTGGLQGEGVREADILAPPAGGLGTAASKAHTTF